MPFHKLWPEIYSVSWLLMKNESLSTSREVASRERERERIGRIVQLSSVVLRLTQ